MATQGQKKKCEMYRVPAHLVESGVAPDWALGISSFFLRRSAIGGVGAAVEEYETYKGKNERVKVTCVTMQELLKQYQVGRVDLLQVDAEGRL